MSTLLCKYLEIIKIIKFYNADQMGPGRLNHFLYLYVLWLGNQTDFFTTTESVTICAGHRKCH